MRRSLSHGWDITPTRAPTKPVILTVGAFQPQGRTRFCLCFSLVPQFPSSLFLATIPSSARLYINLTPTEVPK